MTGRCANPFDDAVFSDHALSEMARRGLSEAEVRGVLSAPDTVFAPAGSWHKEGWAMRPAGVPI